MLTLLSFTCFICALFRYCCNDYYTIEIVVLIRLCIATYALCLDTRRGDVVTFYQNVSHAVGAAYGKHEVGLSFTGSLVCLTVQTYAGRRILLEIFHDVLKYDILLL